MAGMVEHQVPAADRQADARHDDVRRHDALRDGRPRGARGPGLRLPGLPRHGHRRPGDGEARRGRADPGRARHHHDRGRRRGRRRHLAGRPTTGSTPSSAPGSRTCSASAPSTWSTSVRSTPCPSGSDSRTLHVHNAQVTLMRTTPDENRRFARWIAAKLNRAEAPVHAADPRRRRLRARCARPAVLTTPRPTPRFSTSWSRPSSRDPAARSAASRCISMTPLSPRALGRRVPRARRPGATRSTVEGSIVMPGLACTAIMERSAQEGRRRVCRSSAAGPARASAPSARRPAAST